MKRPPRDKKGSIVTNKKCFQSKAIILVIIYMDARRICLKERTIKVENFENIKKVINRNWSVKSQKYQT